MLSDTSGYASAAIFTSQHADLPALAGLPEVSMNFEHLGGSGVRRGIGSIRASTNPLRQLCLQVLDALGIERRLQRHV